MIALKLEHARVDFLRLVKAALPVQGKRLRNGLREICGMGSGLFHRSTAVAKRGRSDSPARRARHQAV
jgi:hypothetical protein